MKLAPDIAPGSYSFICLVHRALMTGDLGGVRAKVLRWWPMVAWSLAAPGQNPAAQAMLAGQALAVGTGGCGPSDLRRLLA